MQSSTQNSKAPRGPDTEPAWASLADEELLDVRICDLRLRLEGSVVQDRIRRLHNEMQAQGIACKPRVYLSTEWLCPDRVPLIGVPFCLAHPRLFALEKTMLLEVEGGTEQTCMQLLRHEAGHAVNYAYRLYRRTHWRNLFGPISREYNVEEYYARPYSRQFVAHLPGNYAQSHPDEDFAETFAVWLTPEVDWRRKYRGSKALKKLAYVGHLVKEIAGRPAEVTTGEKLWPVSRVRSTLRSYYKKKRIEYGDHYPGYYDPELNKVFTADPANGHMTAAAFLRRHRKYLTHQISRFGRFRKYEIDQVLRRMQQRARELNMVLKEDENACLIQLSICLTSLLADYRTRKELQQGA